MDKRQLRKVAEAKKRVFDGQMTIWNTRIEALLDTGDVRAATDAMSAPVDLASNNCDCNSPCDALAGAGGRLVNPAVTRGN